MRVAGHTYSYRDRPLGAALEELAGLGLADVEVWIGHVAGDPNDAVEALRARGLDASALSAGGIYTADAETVARTFDVAAALSVSVVVACLAPQVADWVAERVPAGVTLCVENHWDQPLATAREVERVLATRPLLRACVDTGHSILAGEAPERFVATLGAKVGHVHLKDAAQLLVRERLMGRRLRSRLRPRPRPAFPGTGALDVGCVRAALTAAGFAGTVALEYEGAEPTAALGRLLDAWRSLEGVPAGGV